MQINTRYIALTGLIIFVYILKKIGFKEIFNLLFAVNPSYIILLLPVISLNIFLKGLKWKTIIRAHGFDYPLLDSCKVFLIGIFSGTITPGRIGDVIRAIYLGEKNIAFGKALSTVVIDRILDLLILLFFSASAIMWAGVIPNGRIFPLAILGGFFVFIYLLSRKEIMRKIVKPIFNKFIPDEYKSASRTNFEDFYAGFGSIQKAGVLVAFFLGLGSWLVSILEGYLIALSLGLDLTYSYIFVVIPIVTLVEILPISILGLGTRDTTIIFFFSLKGISPGQSVAFSMLYLLFAWGIVILTGGVLLAANPVKIKKQVC